MVILKKLTLVILTYERPKLLKRVLKYYHKTEINIIILDGSKKSNSYFLETYLNKKIRYFHEPKSYKDRIKLAVEMVKTDYVSTMSDDEFYLKNSLIEILSKLDNDKELVACKGLCLGFKCVNQNLLWTEEYLNQLNYKRNEDDDFERVDKHISRYRHTLYYSVVRKNIWKKSFSTYLKEELSINAQAEIMFEISVSFYGKHCVIPIIHHLKSFDSPSIISDDISLQNSKFEFFELFAKSFKNNIAEKFLENMSKIAGKNRQCLFKNNIKKACQNYSEFYIKKHNPFLIKLKSLFPSNIKFKIKMFIKFLKGKNISEIYVTLNQKKINCSKNELKIIQSIVMSNNK